MMKSYYSLIGVSLGILMVVVDFLIPGGGKGLHAPSVFSTGVLWLIPGVGPKLAMILPPLLWSAYIARLGKIRVKSERWLATGVVLALHIGPGWYVGTNDKILITNWAYLSPITKIHYCIVLVAIGMVLLEAWSGRESGFLRD